MFRMSMWSWWLPSVMKRVLGLEGGTARGRDAATGGVTAVGQMQRVMTASSGEVRASPLSGKAQSAQKPAHETSSKHCAASAAPYAPTSLRRLEDCGSTVAPDGDHDDRGLDQLHPIPLSPVSCRPVMRVLLVSVLVVLVACGGDSGDRPGAPLVRDFDVGRDGDDWWPFTFESGTVRCVIVTSETPDRTSSGSSRPGTLAEFRERRYGRGDGTQRPHVTLRTDGGETYGLNGPAMDRWPSVVQLIPDKWRDPLVSDEALEYRTRASRYVNDWLRQGLSHCTDPIAGWIGAWPGRIN